MNHGQSRSEKKRNFHWFKFKEKTVFDYEPTILLRLIEISSMIAVQLYAIEELALHKHPCLTALNLVRENILAYGYEIREATNGDGKSRD